jgi:hypothetical protein
MRRRSLTPVPGSADTTRRRTVRHVAAALSALVASVYLLIGFDAIRVVDAQATTAGELLPFGLVAGGAFALGAVLLVALDARPLWLVGAAFQVIVLVLYVVVAPERTPPFEIWGVLLRVPQVAMLAALAYLFLSVPDTAPRPGLTRSVT